MNYLQYSFSQYSKEKYPKKTNLKLWGYRVKFLFRALFFKKQCLSLINNIDHVLFKELCTKHQLIEKPFKPYITNHYTPNERVDIIVNHYKFVSEGLPEKIKNQIYLNEFGFELLRFTIGSEEFSCKLTSSFFLKEGEMSLVLSSDETPKFYTLTFSVCKISECLSIIIGGLQGPKSNDINNLKIKEFTKKSHGQRPKDLIVKILTMIANLWGVDQIFAVKNKHHSYCVSRYKLGLIHTNLDFHWKSLGGNDFNTYFYTLPIKYIHRNIDDISRSKRAMYKRRYTWLNDAETEITKKLSPDQLNTLSNCNGAFDE